MMKIIKINKNLLLNFKWMNIFKIKLNTTYTYNFLIINIKI